MNRSQLACAVFAISGAIAPDVDAASVTYTFGGVLTSVSGSVTTPAAGEAFTGQFTFDTSTPGTLFPSLPAVARYDDSATLLQVASGVFQWSATPATITIANDENGAGQTCSTGTCRDRIQINSVSPFNTTGSSLGANSELQLTSVSLFLISDTTFPTTSTVLTDLTLPSVINLSDFGQAQISLSFQDPLNLSSIAIVQGNITSLAPVPLPAAAWLLLSGLGVLGITARRNQRQPAA